MACRRSPVRARLAPLSKQRPSDDLGAAASYTEDLGAESPRPFHDRASFRSLRGLAPYGTCPPRSRPPLAVLAWLDHDHTTAEERGFGSLLVAVRRLFGALRSRG